MPLRLPIATLAFVALVATSCSGGVDEEDRPSSAASGSTARAPTTEPVVEESESVEPCDLLDRFQLRQIMAPRLLRQATWSHELWGKDGNFYGCVLTHGTFPLARFGYALTPNAYAREWREGKLLGEDLSPTETPGLGDRGYIREGFIRGYESMAKTGRHTVYLMGGDDDTAPETVAAKLLFLVASVSDAMLEHPVEVAPECPAIDAREVVRVLGSDIDITQGAAIRGNLYCGYHNEQTRNTLTLQAITFDATGGSANYARAKDPLAGEVVIDPAPGAVRSHSNLVDLKSIASTTVRPDNRYLKVELGVDAWGYSHGAEPARKPQVVYRFGDAWIAEHE